MKKSYLHGGQKAIGSMDDAFYFAEEWLKEGGEAVGEEFGIPKKQVTKKNDLLKTLKTMESKGHFTHSPFQRDVKLLSHFHRKSMLDTKIKRLRKIFNP